MCRKLNSLALKTYEYVDLSCYYAAIDSIARKGYVENTLDQL